MFFASEAFITKKLEFASRMFLKETQEEIFELGSDSEKYMENNKPKENLHITDLIKKINKFLSNEKPADILIIKAHLLCEYYVNQLLIFREKCSHQELESLTFNQKIHKAFNLNDKKEKISFDYTNKLNKLRNKVGHELEYSLSESDIDALGYVQGKEYILNKYDHENDVERLRSILNTIVIDIALLLITSVMIETKKTKPQV